MNRLLAQTLPSKPAGTHGILRIVNQKSKSNKEKFEVLRLATGSILRVDLSANDRIQTRVGAVISSFGKIDTALKTHSSILDSAVRKLAGGTFYIEQFYADNRSSVILAGKEPGDIVMLDMDPTRNLVFRHDSFLLSDGDIRVSVSNIGQGLGKESIFYGFATGTGTLSLTRPGGMYTVSLSPEEDCIVNPRHVIAWDSSMEIIPLRSDSAPEATRTVWRSLEWMTKRGIPFRHAAEATLFYFTKFYRSAVHYYRSVLGDSDLYRLKGPGEIVLSSNKK